MGDWFIVSKKERVASVPKRYAEQYAPYPGEPTWRRKHREKIPLLENAATAEKIDSIIGNDTWTRHRCDFCYEDKEYLICLLEEEQSTFLACAICLNAMLVELDNVELGKK